MTAWACHLSTGDAETGGAQGSLAGQHGFTAAFGLTENLFLRTMWAGPEGKHLRSTSEL